MEFLKEKAPQIFKDGKLDLDAFKLAANLSNQEDDLTEKYGLNWKGKTNSIWRANQKSDKTLIPQRDKSMNFDQSNNIIIEGDNLDVLKTLQASYANKVDVIYIDPPYNTGNDFIYNDDFHQTSNEYKSENNLIDEEGLKTTTNQKTDGRFHTNWLNMMYPRLMLARKLLKEDGVIFISIDDNEQAHLKMLCDEIFGEHNFVNQLIWVSNKSGRQISNKPYSKTSEYILVYSRGELSYENEFDRDWISSLMPSVYDNQEIVLYKDEISEYMIQSELSNSNIKRFNNKTRPNLFFPIYTNGTEISLEKKDGYCMILPPKTKEGIQGVWRWGKNKVLNEPNELVVLKHKEGFKIFTKKRNLVFNAKDLILSSNISTKSGANDIKKIDLNIFDHPKPIALIKFLIKNIDKNALVLDFFAGSGTTGQAVMDLNKEDGGNRQFILVQLPELIENNNDQFKTISDITRERIKRSIEKYGYKEKGFKFFKLDESNLKSTNWTNQNSYQEFQQSLLDLSKKVKSNRSAEDVAYEIVLRAGLPFDKNLHQIEINNNLIFIDDSKSHIFILEPTKNSKYYENIIDVVKEFAKDIAGGLNIYLNDQYFKNDETKINFVEQVKSISDQIKVWVI